MARYEITGLTTIFAFGLACASSGGYPGKISGKELRQRIEAGETVRIIDVRSAREFSSGHLPGALNIPFLEVKRRILEIPRNDEKPLVVYCGHGPRAYWARRVLTKQGHDHVLLLEGHFQSWSQSGYPIEG